MSQLTSVSSGAIFDTFRTASERAKKCSCLQAAAQSAAATLFEAFAESLVLVRIFAVVPYRSLPDKDRHFVHELARAKSVAADLSAETPVLSLLGTRGTQPAWNDRRDSKGHLGIPLTSPNFIQAIPMLARMLHELGADVGLDQPEDKTIVMSVLAGGLGGVFYVPDASKTTDKLGRKVIAAQDFVRSHHVKSVFGVAGNYAGKLSVAILMFTREDLSQKDTKQFLSLVNVFKAATMELVRSGRVFPSVT